MTNDTFHSYTFDAEGNITAVDNGTTATYVYNAQNQRVKATVGSTITEYVFSAAGQRVSEWNGTTRAQIKGKYYWGGKPVAYYAGGSAHFEHQDWLGTERMRTAYNGGVEGSTISLPWGDGQTTTGTDLDANHYGTLDYDAESGTDHAQFRQYSSAQGRWLAPDPYSGSYTVRNPQSFNRYVYAGNNPLAAVDPSGMLDCGSAADSLYACGVPIMSGLGGGEYGEGGWGDVFSTVECQIDGFDVPCGIAYSAAQSGAAVQCPNNECGWTNIGGVAAHVVAYQTGISYVPAGGVDSKYSTKDQATIAGALYQYNKLLLNGSSGNPIKVYQTADGMFLTQMAVPQMTTAFLIIGRSMEISCPSPTIRIKSVLYLWWVD
jgi:RHS repeat-associated protein